PHRRIEDMAEEYLNDIRTLQPTGPYYLAGYSAGGLAAWEIARKLRGMGESVALLVLFDTTNPKLGNWSQRERMQQHLAHFRERGIRYLGNRLVARLSAEAERLR